LGEPQPTQAIEKIMRVVAGWDALVRMNERFIGHAIGQHVLRHKLLGRLGAKRAV
jgi:hypothetical protein